MQRTRLSLYYLCSYLLIGGLVLLFFPQEGLRLLLSKGDYGDAPTAIMRSHSFCRAPPQQIGKDEHMNDHHGWDVENRQVVAKSVTDPQCPLWVKSGLSSQRHSMSALPLKADI